MVQACCVCLKKYEKSGSLTFHRFPRDPDLREKWEEVLGVYVAESEIESKKICADHFEKKDFIRINENVYVKAGAVPIPYEKCVKSSVMTKTKETSKTDRMSRSATSSKKSDLNISPNDLDFLKDSQHIEFVVEEDDLPSDAENDSEDPVYLYVEDEEDRGSETETGESNDRDSSGMSEIIDIPDDSDVEMDDYEETRRKKEKSKNKKETKTPPKEQKKTKPDIKLTKIEDLTKKVETKPSPSRRKQTILTRNSSSLLKNTSTPLKNTSTPLKNTSTPLKNSSTPLKNSSTPTSNVSTPTKSTSSLLKNPPTPRKIAPSPMKKTTPTRSTPIKIAMAPPKPAVNLPSHVVHATNVNQNQIVTPIITSIQGGVGVFPVVPADLPQSPSQPSGVQKMPDHAVFEIIKALGLSVQDIQKCGGSVAITVPRSLIKDGVLDLTNIQRVTPAPPQVPSVHNTQSVKAKSANVPNTSVGSNKKVLPILPKVKCYIESCGLYETKENLLISAPYDNETRKVWDICLGSINRRLTANDKICKKHFHDSDILPKSNTLVTGAVPCITYREYCCVPNCQTKQPAKMYNFPVYNKTNNQLWLYLVRNPSLKSLNIRELVRHRVCYLHFDKGSFTSDEQLRRTAAPTKFIPDCTALKIPTAPPSFPDFSKIELRCAYKNCKERLNSSKRVYSFPADFDRCQDWLYACDRLDLLSRTADATYTKLFCLKFGICENHFEDKEFDNRALKILGPTAQPRMFNPGNLIDDTDLPPVQLPENIAATKKGEDILETTRQKSKNILSNVCFYLGCNKKYSEKVADEFFSFPAEPGRRKVWLEACGYKNFSDVAVNYKICKDHFTENNFARNGKLRPYAVPIRSAQIVDGDGLETGLRGSEPTNETDPLELIVDAYRTEMPSVNSAKVNEIMVSKLANKSTLEFLRCAIPKCDKVFTNQTYQGNAQLFPDPKINQQWYNTWLHIIGSPILMAMPPDILRQTYVICNDHFDEISLLNNGVAIIQNTIPTKNLPKILPIEIDEFSRPQQKRTPTVAVTSPDGLQWKQLDPDDLGDPKDKTMCVLEDSNIVFPGMGHYLVEYQKDPQTTRQKRPYSVIRYSSSKSYGKVDVGFGEALNIHTAIIVDDTDEAEREVLQMILDKRLKKS